MIKKLVSKHFESSDWFKIRSEVLPELVAKIDELVSWSNQVDGLIEETKQEKNQLKYPESETRAHLAEIRCLLKDGGYRIRAAGPSSELYLEDSAGEEFRFRLTSDGDYDPLH